MSFLLFVSTTIYFLALINPPSKILFLCGRIPPYEKQELIRLSWRATLAALAILVIFTTAGNFVLENIFHVEIYSLSVAGGIVLFLVGLTAVRAGRFHEDNIAATAASVDVSIVPLAAPLIAGPGVITAALSFASSIHSVTFTLLCLFVALMINFVLMLMSLQIGRAMERLHITGPIIRITGLIVMAVSVQMIFSGAAAWLTTTLHLIK